MPESTNARSRKYANSKKGKATRAAYLNTVSGQTARARTDIKARANRKERDRVKKRNRDLITNTKRVPCSDCGGSFHPVCMDFDHRPGEIKLFNIGPMRIQALSKLRREIAKCDIVCSNCHRLRTLQRRLDGVMASALLPKPQLPLFSDEQHQLRTGGEA